MYCSSPARMVLVIVIINKGKDQYNYLGITLELLWNSQLAYC
jgi:hypothetical protein